MLVSTFVLSNMNGVPADFPAFTGFPQADLMLLFNGFPEGRKKAAGNLPKAAQIPI
jgi:hypothetical protein